MKAPPQGQKATRGVFCCDSGNTQATCESRVYIVDGTGAHQIMEDVTHVQQEDGVYLLVNLLGEQRLVRGRIVRVDFLTHSAYLESAPDTFSPLA
jgi:predicted RNA-binding protein